MESKSIVLLKRAIRTFGSVLMGAVATAMVAITIELSKGHTISSYEELKKLGLSLIPVFGIAFFGAIAASLEKNSRWVTPQNPEPLTNEPQQ